MKKLITSILLLSSLGLFAQEVTIPDAEFLNALTSLGSKPGNQKVDTNGDGKIQISEAESTVELLYLSDWTNITDLTGIEAFTNLKLLVCSQTKLASLDVSMLPNLEEVVVINNELTSLKVHPNLQRISCPDNAPLTGTLDLSQNTNLNYLVARNNNLEKICLPSIALVTDNPNSFVKDATTEWSDECVQECIVEIPDANFKNALLARHTIDTNGDGEIQCEEAEAYKGIINVSAPTRNPTTTVINQLHIKDLTGIEAFPNIVELYCRYNYIDKIDISNNKKLRKFSCFVNNIKELNLSENTLLIYLSCGGNPYTSQTIDVSKNTNITEFHCSYSTLTNVNLETNTKLKVLNLSRNYITPTINLQNQPELKTLNIISNQIEYLDISQNPQIQAVYLSNNPLTLNDIIQQQRTQKEDHTVDFSNNLLLDSLDISNTGITSLDLTHNTALTYVKCDSTDNLTTIYVPSVADAENNPNFIKDENDIWTERVLSVFENEGTTRKHIVKAYNFQGVEVPVETKGQMIILLYSDGTTQKIFGE